VYEILARDRVAELERTAEVSAWNRRRAGRGHRPQVVRSARKATGWFLVDIGLRLADPRELTRSA
jgi:hypothetical protein